MYFLKGHQVEIYISKAISFDCIYTFSRNLLSIYVSQRLTGTRCKVVNQNVTIKRSKRQTATEQININIHIDTTCGK